MISELSGFHVTGDVIIDGDAFVTVVSASNAPLTRDYLEVNSWTVQQTGTTIYFDDPYVYNTRSAPASGNLSVDYTGAKLGITQKVYHQDSVEPTIPGTWLPAKENDDYLVDNLNVLYVEYIGSNQAEYWWSRDDVDLYVDGVLYVDDIRPITSLTTPISVHSDINMMGHSITNIASSSLVFETGAAISSPAANTIFLSASQFAAGSSFVPSPALTYSAVFGTDNSTIAAPASGAANLIAGEENYGNSGSWNIIGGIQNFNNSGGGNIIVGEVNNGNIGWDNNISGYLNRFNSGDSNVIGGYDNQYNSGSYNVIAGADDDYNSGDNNIICGSGNTSNSGNFNMIAGIDNNSNSGDSNIIGGGNNNNNVGWYNIISGEHNYGNLGSYNLIAGAGNSDNAGEYNVIGGAEHIDILATHSAIFGIRNSTATYPASGASNLIVGDDNYGNTKSWNIIAGRLNRYNSGELNAIFGGNNGNNSGDSNIIGGDANTDNSGNNNLIVGSNNYNNSGSYNIIGGYEHFNNSGSYNIIAGLEHQNNAKDYGVITGNGTGHYLTANRIHSAQPFPLSIGSAQIRDLVASRNVVHSTTNWSSLGISGGDPTKPATSPTNAIVIPNNAAWNVEIKLVGTNSTATSAFGFNIEGLVKNSSGTVSVVSQSIVELHDPSPFEAQITEHASTSSMLIQVRDTAAAGEDMRWVARIESAEVVF